MISFLLCFISFFPFQGDISDRRTRNPVLATLCNVFSSISFLTSARLYVCTQNSLEPAVLVTQRLSSRLFYQYFLPLVKYCRRGALG